MMPYTLPYSAAPQSIATRPPQTVSPPGRLSPRRPLPSSRPCPSG